MRALPRLVAAGAIALAACSPGGASSTEGGAAGAASVAPPPRVDAPALVDALAARPERALLVNFWATWCDPCVKELPALESVAASHAGRDAAVVLVSVDPSPPGGGPGPDEVAAFLEGRGVDLPGFYYDADLADLEEPLGFGGVVPFTVTLDAEREVVATQAGAAGEERFAEMLDAALGR